MFILQIEISLKYLKPSKIKKTVPIILANNF